MLEARICAALAKEAQPPTTTERMGLRGIQERAAALEVDQIGSHYGAKDHERIRSKQDRLMEVAEALSSPLDALSHILLRVFPPPLVTHSSRS